MPHCAAVEPPPNDPPGFGVSWVNRSTPENGDGDYDTLKPPVYTGKSAITYQGVSHRKVGSARRGTMVEPTDTTAAISSLEAGTSYNIAMRRVVR